MLSKILEMQQQIIKNNPVKQVKKTTPFPRDKKRSLSNHSVKEDTLSALKHMLAKQKEATPSFDAAGPFYEMQSYVMATNDPGSLSLDPSMQVMQLYNNLVEKMIHINREGIQETTFFLDAQNFSSSIFYGSKITITEYSTAPKTFNISFSSTAAGVSLFETHAAELMNAFQNGNFGFTVHRIDTGLLTEDEKHAISPVNRDKEQEEESSHE